MSSFLWLKELILLTLIFFSFFFLYVFLTFYVLLLVLLLVLLHFLSSLFSITIRLQLMEMVYWSLMTATSKKP